MPDIFTSTRTGLSIAHHKTDGRKPGVMFCGGFMSDMTGTKAGFLEERCRARGQAYVRFDYAGHGASEGKFIDGNIGKWLEDALEVFDRLTEGPQVVAGSSMGGWIALLLALARKDRVKGLIGLAPAPDFTEDVFNDEFSDAQRREVTEQGIIYLPSGYGEPYPLTRQLFEDGRKHLLLNDTIDITCPVRLIHGKQDPDVPWQKSEHIQKRLASKDVKIIWIDDGDHRLSRPQDLDLIDAAVVELSGP